MKTRRKEKISYHFRDALTGRYVKAPKKTERIIREKHIFNTKTKQMKIERTAAHIFKGGFSFSGVRLRDEKGRFRSKKNRTLEKKFSVESYVNGVRVFKTRMRIITAKEYRQLRDIAKKAKSTEQFKEFMGIEYFETSP
jgi:hypothetical protein